MVLWGSIALVLFSAREGWQHVLEQPERFYHRVWGRELDAAEVSSQLPFWQRFLNFGSVSAPEECLSEAIAAFRQLSRDGLSPGEEDRVRTLAVLLAEAQRLEEARQELQLLPDELSGREFKRAFQAAYLEAGAPAQARTLLRAVAVEPEWARNKLGMRLAARAGDQARVREIRERLEARGWQHQRRITLVSLLHFSALAAGLAVLVRCGRRCGWREAIGEGRAVSPWTISEGYAVLVRGGVAALPLVGGLVVLSQWVPLVAGSATLLSAIPFCWLASRWLLQPYGERWRSLFGFQFQEGGWREIPGWTIALLALVISGELVVGLWVADSDLGGLAESIPEEFLFGAWDTVVASALDAIVWAPLVEEIVFRGVLYTTLRRRLSPWMAALASAVLFGMVHGYSLAGFVVICWSGFLWAVAYEKSRTLWPAILCHAASNSLAVFSPLILYRW